MSLAFSRACWMGTWKALQYFRRLALVACVFKYISFVVTTSKWMATWKTSILWCLLFMKKQRWWALFRAKRSLHFFEFHYLYISVVSFHFFSFLIISLYHQWLLIILEFSFWSNFTCIFTQIFNSKPYFSMWKLWIKYFWQYKICW